MYDLVGVYPSQSFFSLQTLADGSARILLREDLRSDNLQLSHYILRVRAFDSVYPDAVATSDVNVVVERNRNGPRFEPDDVYERKLSDSFEVGEQVLQVRAVDDDDGDVIRFEAVDKTSSVWQVFLLDERTGVIYLIKPLTNTMSSFQVSSPKLPNSHIPVGPLLVLNLSYLNSL